MMNNAMTEEQAVAIMQKMLPVLEEMKTYNEQNSLWLDELFLRAYELSEQFKMTYS